MLTTNEHYNRCLKEIAEAAGTPVLLITHSARYFFANEVLYNNGGQFKTICEIMGHQAVQSTEVYVRANRTAASESKKWWKQDYMGRAVNLGSHPGPKRGPKWWLWG